MQVYKAIKYIRLSYTDDKTVESDSVANQRRLIDDYIARHPEIEVVAEKIDDGYSGVLFDRPAFQEMMRMIEQGEANCVIVKDLSRLGREYIETGRYMRRVFPAYGVRFIAINDNVDTENDAADDLTVSVKNIMNEACSWGGRMYMLPYHTRPACPAEYVPLLFSTFLGAKLPSVIKFL